MNRVLRPLSLITVLLAVAGCQGGDSEGSDEASEVPSPVPAEQMEAAELPEDPGELADLVADRMETAQTVDVGISLEPDEEEAAPVESTTMTLRMLDPPTARMEVVESDKETPTTTEIIVIDGVVYTRLEGQAIVDGKSWMRLSREDVAEAESELGPFAEIFTVVLDETDAALTEATGDTGLDVVRLGELTEDPETVAEDGAELTRFTGETSAYDVADAGNETYRDLVDAGLEEVSWTLTVGDKGLPSEFSTEILTPDGRPATSTVSYSDWGAEVEIAAPPEEDTGTLQESLSG
ncbi:hypothetical protein HDA32_004309 [Spinactinospora alkalitolerans]|uniref:LppX_LprAFG lipoprotein n=1 Tax=Spinactinospora alkalitolerans TaxID=687207 RepID=A0A852TYY0_9ACTN|nr:hypothetical protein [Spinactinospora alkalitolerans]NYE49189.1 hypothetical protein [Spinactinospora alkalitolerans]